jgi:hypothetical protein
MTGDITLNHATMSEEVNLVKSEISINPLREGEGHGMLDTYSLCHAEDSRLPWSSSKLI